MIPYIVKRTKKIIDNYMGEETVFWDGEYLYSRQHGTEISLERAEAWAMQLMLESRYVKFSF